MGYEAFVYPFFLQEPKPIQSAGRETAGTFQIPLTDLDPIFDKSNQLITPNRIIASSALGPYARIFGRDTIITSAKKVESYRHAPNGQVDMITPAIIALHRLVAPEDVPIAGIHKGDLVHETGAVSDGFPDNWFTLGEGRIGFNYDSLDAADRAINLDYDLISLRPELHAQLASSIALMVERGIKNAREYEGAAYVRASDQKDRLYPGITDHRWRDGYASTVKDDLSFPPHPLRPVEEQALRWSALLKGADLIEGRNPHLAKEARAAAMYVQKQFLSNFFYQDTKGLFIADAVDATGEQLHALTIDPILTLQHEYQGATIIGDPAVEQTIIQRSFDELYDRKGGFKTVSENGPVHPLNKYQGPKSRWPHASAMAVKAIANVAERTADPCIRAELCEKIIQLGEATLDPLVYFGSPVEAVHVTENGEYTLEYDITPEGKRLKYAEVQAWAGAGGEFIVHKLRSLGKNHITLATTPMNGQYK